MKARQFSELPEIEDLTTVKRFKIGSKFLTGNSVIAQKENKKVGDIVTYYEVTGIDTRGNISYKPVYERMEE